jgi:hypothetical protein
MQGAKSVVTLAVILLTTITLVADKVTSDFDHAVDFSQFRTYMWIQEPNGAGPLMKNRIVSYVDNQLQIRGLRLVNDGADLAVGANVATELRHTWETYYSGDGWGWGGSIWATTTEKTYEVGTLTVDLFDVQTKRLVWEGIATDTLSYKPAKQTKNYAKQVEKMFKGFPPVAR